MSAVFETLSPILPSRHLAATEAFYARIGFATEYVDADYLLMKRDAAEVHFFHAPAQDPATNDHGAYLRPHDIDAFSAEVAARGLPADPGFLRVPPGGDRPRARRAAVMPGPEGGPVGPGRVSPGRDG